MEGKWLVCEMLPSFSPSLAWPHTSHFARLYRYPSSLTKPFTVNMYIM